MPRDLTDPAGPADLTELLGPAARSGASQYGSAPLESTIRFDFDAGLPDPDTFPVDDLVRLAERVLRADPGAALHYGRQDILYGFGGLREHLASDAGVDVRQVMLTSGGAQGISLCCDAVTGPDSVVAVEIPTWGYMLRQIPLSGAQVVAVPTDDDGLRVDLLAEQVARLRRAGRRLAAVYVIANFGVPTGVCLSRQRRRDLVELAARERFVIIEDNTYGSLRYDGEDLPSLLELDQAGVVLRVDSFSKTIAPGLRLGWVTGPAELIAGLAAVRRDLGVSQWTARTISAYLDEELFAPHLERVRTRYRHKRDAADDALQRHCGDSVRRRRPEGGFFYWLELPSGIDATTLMARAAQAGVTCRPGERFFGDADSGRHHVRLAFSAYPEADLDHGIRVLGEVLRELTPPGAPCT